MSGYNFIISHPVNGINEMLVKVARTSADRAGADPSGKKAGKRKTADYDNCVDMYEFAAVS
jgi:hypothetical protein